MNRRGTGVAFCFISALFVLARYFIAAILGINKAAMHVGIFDNLLNYTGNALVFLSVICLCIGVAYLIFAEIKKDK